MTHSDSEEALTQIGTVAGFRPLRTLGFYGKADGSACGNDCFQLSEQHADVQSNASMQAWSPSLIHCLPAIVNSIVKCTTDALQNKFVAKQICFVMMLTSCATQLLGSIHD